MKKVVTICAALQLANSAPALAQRAQENALATAGDGFGTSVGNERVGVYTTSNVRGFSPITAGNRRIEGLYFDLGGNGLTNRLIAGSTIRVGLPALAYPFPAPSGIVDYRLRRPGDRPVLSGVATLPPYSGATIELDGQLPLSGRVAVAGGLAAGSNIYADGRRTTARSAAILPELTFDATDILGFYGVAQTGGSVPPIMITSGPALPPLVDSQDFNSHSWIDTEQVSHTYGALGSTRFSDSLELRLGAFESRSVRRRSFANLFTNVQPDGSATEVVISDPSLPARWTSGEARLTWQDGRGSLRQQVVFSVRGRDKHLKSGGSDTAVLGPARLGLLTPLPSLTSPMASRRSTRSGRRRSGSTGSATWRAGSISTSASNEWNTDPRSRLPIRRPNPGPHPGSTMRPWPMRRPAGSGSTPAPPAALRKARRRRPAPPIATTRFRPLERAKSMPG